MKYEGAREIAEHLINRMFSHLDQATKRLILKTREKLIEDFARQIQWKCAEIEQRNHPVNRYL